MKSKWVSFLACFTVVLSICLAPAPAQDQPDQPKAYFTSRPLRSNTVENAVRESQSGQTIPMWTYSTYTTVDSNLYTGQIMGGAPNTGTTTIPTYIVPLIVVMPDGTVFDPNAPDPNCAGGTPLTITQNSPLFQNAGPWMWGLPPFGLGNSQYIDALQRAEFFKLLFLGPLNYHWHTVLGLNTTAPVTLVVPSDQGQSYVLAGCNRLGVINIDWLDNYITTTLIPSLAGQGVGPTTFPVVLTYNIYLASQGHNLFIDCCYVGYHGAYGSPMQVYGEAEFDSNGHYGSIAQDVTIVAHELGEAVNDPTGLNLTPAWGHVGQQQNCQNNFEVGDPLTGTQYPPVTVNGYIYHLQELAMYSWFYRPSQMVQPSRIMGDLGVPNWYSTHGTFRHDAGPICQ